MTAKGPGWLFVLNLALVQLFVLMEATPLMAGKPEFSISNDFEREETLIPGVRSVVDTYTQDYQANWSEVYSSRLSVDLDFELELEDIIRLLDVDEKTVTPSFELAATGLFWELTYFFQDAILYSNEYNTARRDEIEYSLDITVEPIQLFPTFTGTVQRLINYQPNLEDSVEDKTDISADYSFLELLLIDVIWKEETLDDRFLDDNDSLNREWEFKVSSSQTVTQSLKVDLVTSLSGDREETLNNAGAILDLEQDRIFDGNLKFTLETFPNFTSSLELTRTDEMVDDEVENTIDLKAEYSNLLVNLGDLTETVEIIKTDISEPTEKTNELETDLSVKLEGEPNRFLNYSVEYLLGFDRLNDHLDPGGDKDTQEDEFNLSFTWVVKEGISLENAFTWSVTREDGTRSDASKTFKISGLFEGEYLDLPNLVFTPDISYESEKDFVESESSDVLSLTLGLLYTFVMPSSFEWSLETEYNWEDSDGDMTHGLTFNSDFKYVLSGYPWEIEFGEIANREMDFTGEEGNFWTHEITLAVERELTPTILFDAEYEYEYDEEETNSDSVEYHLEWAYRSSGLNLGFLRERVFEEGLDVVNTYTVEFFMDF